MRVGVAVIAMLAFLRRSWTTVRCVPAWSEHDAEIMSHATLRRRAT